MVYINGIEYECKVAHQQPTNNSQQTFIDQNESKIADGILTFAQAHTGMVAGKFLILFLAFK